MNPRLVTVAIAALGLSFAWAQRMHAQDSESTASSSGSAKSISDREKAGLHGPVRSVIEEQTSPEWHGADGNSIPEMKTSSKTEYDREGRIAVMRGRGWSREKGMDAADSVTRYTYNTAGQLLRMTTEKNGEPDREVVYKYDDQGRLQSITDSGDPNDPIAFRYDATGRKTKIAIAQPTDLPQGAVSSRSVEASFGTAASAPALPQGGSAITLYDDQGRPAEIQTRNANGEIVYRALRTYDEQGHVIEERQTLDDPLAIIPAADQKKILDAGAVPVLELRKQIAEALGGSEISSMKYTYDAQGRNTQINQEAMMGRVKQKIETAYNEHGDIAKQTTQYTTTGIPNAEHDESGGSERIFSYEYDNEGNWTVKKTSSRSLPDGTFKDTGEEVRRTIEYY